MEVCRLLKIESGVNNQIEVDETIVQRLCQSLDEMQPVFTLGIIGSKDSIKNFFKLIVNNLDLQIKETSDVFTFPKLLQYSYANGIKYRVLVLFVVSCDDSSSADSIQTQLQCLISICSRILEIRPNGKFQAWAHFATASLLHHPFLPSEKNVCKNLINIKSALAYLGINDVRGNEEIRYRWMRRDEYQNLVDIMPSKGECKGTWGTLLADIMPEAVDMKTQVNNFDVFFNLADVRELLLGCGNLLNKTTLANPVNDASDSVDKEYFGIIDKDKGEIYSAARDKYTTIFQEKIVTWVGQLLKFSVPPPDLLIINKLVVSETMLAFEDADIKITCALLSVPSHDDISQLGVVITEKVQALQDLMTENVWSVKLLEECAITKYDNFKTMTQSTWKDLTEKAESTIHAWFKQALTQTAAEESKLAEWWIQNVSLELRKTCENIFNRHDMFSLDHEEFFDECKNIITPIPPGNFSNDVEIQKVNDKLQQVIEEIKWQQTIRKQKIASKIITKMRERYQTEIELFLTRNKHRVEATVLKKFHDELAHKLRKDMEDQMATNVSKLEQCDGHWMTLAAHINKYFDFVKETNNENLMQPPLSSDEQQCSMNDPLVYQANNHPITSPDNHNKKDWLIYLTFEQATVYIGKTAEAGISTKIGVLDDKLVCSLDENEDVWDSKWTFDQYFPHRINLARSESIQINNTTLQITAEFLLGFLFRKIKHYLEQVKLHEFSGNVMIAVPYIFTNWQRIQVYDSANVAGFNEITIINEANLVAAGVTTKLDRNTKFILLLPTSNLLFGWVYIYSKLENELQCLGNLKEKCSFQEGGIDFNPDQLKDVIGGLKSVGLESWNPNCSETSFSLFVMGRHQDFEKLEENISSHVTCIDTSIYWQGQLALRENLLIKKYEHVYDLNMKAPIVEEVERSIFVQCEDNLWIVNIPSYVTNKVTSKEVLVESNKEVWLSQTHASTQSCLSIGMMKVVLRDTESLTAEKHVSLQLSFRTGNDGIFQLEPVRLPDEFKCEVNTTSNGRLKNLKLLLEQLLPHYGQLTTAHSPTKNSKTKFYEKCNTIKAKLENGDYIIKSELVKSTILQRLANFEIRFEDVSNRKGVRSEIRSLQKQLENRQNRQVRKS